MNWCEGDDDESESASPAAMSPLNDSPMREQFSRYYADGNIDSMFDMVDAGETGDLISPSYFNLIVLPLSPTSLISLTSVSCLK